MKTSIVVCCYNNVELVKETVESVLNLTTGDWELILIDNHSLDQRSRDYIKQLNNPSVRIIEPGKNIGCHRAISLGFEQSVGDYLVKLDDDTVIETQDWNLILIDALKEIDKERMNKFSFIAPNCNVRQTTMNTIFKTSNHNLEMVLSGVLGFSCVMIPKNIYKELGKLESRFWGDGQIKNDTLYGGEELYYCQRAVSNGYCYGYCNDVNVKHLDNEYRDPDYVLWKFWCGFRGQFNGMGLDELKKDNNELIRAYTNWMNTFIDNQWIQEVSKKRINELKI